MVVGALQIAIVLASVSIVTRIRSLTAGPAVLGGIALVYGILVKAGAVQLVVNRVRTRRMLQAFTRR